MADNDNQNQRRPQSYATQNKVSLMGYIGKKNFKFTVSPSGVPRANFSIGTEKVSRDQETGELISNMEWTQCVAFRKQAEILDRAMRGENERAFRLMMEGRLSHRSYQDRNSTREDGSHPMVYRTEVVAQRLTFVGPIAMAPADNDDSGDDETEIPVEDSDDSNGGCDF